MTSTRWRWRAIVSHVGPAPRPVVNFKAPKEPLFPAEDIMGIVAASEKTSYDARTDRAVAAMRPAQEATCRPAGL